MKKDEMLTLLIKVKNKNASMGEVETAIEKLKEDIFKESTAKRGNKVSKSLAACKRMLKKSPDERFKEGKVFVAGQREYRGYTDTIQAVWFKDCPYQENILPVGNGRLYVDRFLEFKKYDKAKTCEISYKDITNDIKIKKALVKASGEKVILMGSIGSLCFDLERLKTLMEILMVDSVELKYSGEREPMGMETENGWAVLMPIVNKAKVPYEMKNYEN